MSEIEGRIVARFVATTQAAAIFLRYGPIDMTVKWPRSNDPDSDLRYLRTLIANLPEILAKGTEEIWIQDQSRRLEYELGELFRDQEGMGSE